MSNKYKTILTMVTGFLTLFIIFQKVWMAYTAFGIGILSLLSPLITHWILKIWFGIAKILGYINSRILLSIIYFLVLFPLALINKLLGNQSITLKKGAVKSYFTIRNHKYVKGDFEKPW